LQARWALTGQNGIGKAGLGQQAKQDVGLILVIGSSVLGVWKRALCWESLKFLDSIFYVHVVGIRGATDFKTAR
jgi:hypothetical protein